ncbi:MAG TPA: DNA replication/repair protein RecF [Gammaproteobacteria bacterium]|nr:DNA replication/repair protein RecF [Gammaproteobacteria bacterium]
MGLIQLNVSNLRNITQATLSPHPAFNLITGANGSGKTSLLEAIYFLGRGRSFKTSNSEKLIQKGKHELTISGRIRLKEREFQLGIQRAGKRTRIRLAGQTITRASQLTEALPIQIIEPGLHAFFEQGPEIRRRFLEWGVFHVEPRYEQVWRNYRRALQQRNAALKAGWRQSAIGQWDALLVESARLVDTYRQVYVERIEAFLKEFPERERIGFMKGMAMDYYPGWKQGADLGEVLAASLDSDRVRGFTQSGPHRADIRFKMSGERGRDVLSRGQQKLFISLLFLAQSILLRELTGKDSLILIDDLAAELDESSRATLVSVLLSTGSQVFITATTLDMLAGLQDDLPHALFHVEHGNVEQVV